MNNIGPKQRLSTRLAFLTAGLAMAAWAPLVPYVKAQLGLGEAELGLLLLCLGVGSLMAMPLTGVLAARLGCRRVVLIAGGLVSVPAMVRRRPPANICTAAEPSTSLGITCRRV